MYNGAPFTVEKISPQAGSLCATISGNKFITRYRKLRGTNIKENSLVNQKIIFIFVLLANFITNIEVLSKLRMDGRTTKKKYASSTSLKLRP